jgi:hypothetical protein
VAEQGEAAASVHLALDHLKSYVESAGVIMHLGPGQAEQIAAP